MRQAIIAGNWKMNKTITEAIELANGLMRNLIDTQGVDIVLCPPYTSLSDVSEIINDSNIELGAQNIHWEEKGAFTGEISSSMLKDVGAKFVIIGHSERRQYFSETNEGVNKKISAALNAGLTPIVCVGENLKERESGAAFDVIKDHIVNGLKNLNAEDALKLVIAYEPVWAIGTGKNATPQQAQEVHAFIRKLLSDAYGADAAENIRIQYGGSIKPANATDLMSQPDVDGGLIGGASLDIDSFTQIVKAASEIKK